jgi:hypothetical protein
MIAFISYTTGLKIIAVMAVIGFVLWIITVTAITFKAVFHWDDFSPLFLFPIFVVAALLIYPLAWIRDFIHCNGYFQIFFKNDETMCIGLTIIK